MIRVATDRAVLLLYNDQRVGNAWRRLSKLITEAFEFCRGLLSQHAGKGR